MRKIVVLLLILLALLPLSTSPSRAQPIADVYHNSRDLLYRSPFGAVPTGTDVTAARRRDLPDLPGSLPQWRQRQRSRRQLGYVLWQPAAPLPQDLERNGRRLPQSAGRAAEPGLLRRRPERHPGETAVPQGPRRDGDLPEPDLPGAKQPPL